MPDRPLSPDPAFAVATLEIIDELLSISEGPEVLAKRFAQSLRELTGYGVVSFFRAGPAASDCKLLSALPERRRAEIERAEALALARAGMNGRAARVVQAGEASDEGVLLRSLGWENAVLVPLFARENPIGCLVMLGIPDIVNLKSVIHHLELMARQVAGIFDAAYLHEHLEHEVRHRTEELERSIAELRRSQIANLENETRYQMIFENAADAVFIVDDQARMLAVNAAACERLGYARNELMAMRIFQIDSPDEARHVPELIAKLMSAGRHVFETIHLRKDGSPVPTEVNACRVSWKGIPAMMSICRDITDRKRAEEALIRAERLAAVGQLAAGVAHEFNNILAIIRVNAQLLEMNPGLGSEEEIRGQLEIIERETHRGAQVASGIMMLSRPSPPVFKATPIAPLIDHVLAVQKKSFEVENILVTRAIPPGLVIHADANRIEQVLLNLVLNARDAMKSKGGGRLAFFASEAAGEILLRVEDTGEGMDRETQDRLFTPFFTTKGAFARDNQNLRGNGLGLAVSYAIMQEHGGRIEVESAPGVGTSMTLCFPPAPAGAEVPPPAAEALPPAPPVSETAPVAAGGSRRVLLVDDEVEVGIALRRFLEKRGFAVTVMSDGTAGLREVMEKDFTAFVFDINMPTVGGRELATAARRKNPEAPIIFATGEIDEEILKTIREEFPAAKLLMKPFNLKDLLEKLTP